MIVLDVDNRYTYLRNIDEKSLRRIKEITSYFIKGAWFSSAYQNKYWDGKEKLLKFNREKGYYFPTGLLNDVTYELRAFNKKYKIETKNKRKVKAQNRVLYSWNQKIKLRKYQQDVVGEISKKGIFQLNGIIKMPTRSGKTIVAAKLISDFCLKTLFVVPSKSLLYQTIESLENSLLTDVGIIGDSKWEEKNVTVCIIQTLTSAKKRKDQRYDELLKNYDFLLFDEAHHLMGNSWSNTILDFDIPHKLGMSATAFPELKSQWEKGAIWLKACCGNIRVNIEPTELIEQGFLAKPKICLFPVREPQLNGFWSKKLQREAIYKNKFRNKLIVNITKKILKKDSNVLVICERLIHIKKITTLFEKNNIDYHKITGEDRIGERKTKIKDFEEKRINVLIGTIFGEGIDIPSIECVINAEGGSDIKSTLQRMRNLTINPDKKKALFVDFLDLTSPYYARHSKQRLLVYRSEPGFDVKYLNDYNEL